MPASCPRTSGVGAPLPDVVNVANFRLDEPALRTRMRLVMSGCLAPSLGSLSIHRHGRAWHDHPRICLQATYLAHRNSWMVGPSPTMTGRENDPSALRDGEVLVFVQQPLRLL